MERIFYKNDAPFITFNIFFITKKCLVLKPGYDHFRKTIINQFLLVLQT